MLGAVGDVAVEFIAVDIDGSSFVPDLGGGLPGQCRPPPEGVQYRDHLTAGSGKRRGILSGRAVEPGAVLAVLALELPVEARQTRRPMQEQDAVVLQESTDARCFMTPGTIGSPDERRAVRLEVFPDGCFDGSAVVARRQGQTRTVRGMPIGRDEGKPGPLGCR